jgi:ferric-dicitrate binding protein FerR (iron transport regulator)
MSEPMSPAAVAEAAAERAEAVLRAAQEASRRPTLSQTEADDRRSRRLTWVAVLAILAALAAIVVVTVLAIGQARQYQEQVTKRQTACVTSSGTWQQNVGGEWECRH